MTYRLVSLVSVLAFLVPPAVFGCSATGGRRRGPGGGRDSGVLPDGARVPDTGPGVFTCGPGEAGCLGNVHYICGADGLSRTTEIVCDDACDPALLCVLCNPGARQCQGNVSMQCAPNGLSWFTGRDCTEWGSTCGAAGYCTDPCGDAEESRSNIGCEYWPAPLANSTELNGMLFDFRVVVSNPNGAPAHVTVTRGGTTAADVMVPAGDLMDIVLPWVPGQSFVGANMWTSMTTADGAYRLVSDLPVTVAQFNPFEYRVGPNCVSGADCSFSNDATILLPVHVLTGDYIGASYVPLSLTTGSRGGPFPGSDSSIKIPGFIAIVGVSPEPTLVEVRLSGDIAADSGGRFPAARRGETIMFTLNRGEVVQLLASQVPDCGASRPGYNRVEDCSGLFGMCDYFDTCEETAADLTGSRITARQPVAVFGGHVCAYVPYTAEACDHLEVQLPPLETWGTDFVSQPMVDLGSSRDNIVRVIAAFDGTNVTVTPAQGGIGGGTLSGRDYLQFTASGPFHVLGDQPVMVVQFLLGQRYTNPPAMRGDPAMTVLVPREQYRSDYVFVTPTSYNATSNGQSYVLVSRAPGTDVILDGTAVAPAWASIGGREIGIVAVPGGTHSASSADTFGLIAYGMGSFTSYAYPAGLNLEQIVILF